MKKLEPLNLYAIPVPMDSIEIHFGNHCIGFKSDADWFRDTNGWCLIEMGLFAINKYDILGNITAAEITFDVDPYIEPSKDFPEYKYGGEMHPKEMYWDYEYKSFMLENSDDSFRSLLQANRLHFVNPYGQRPEYFEGAGASYRKRCAEILQWEKANENLIEKLLIIQPK